MLAGNHLTYEILATKKPNWSTDTISVLTARVRKSADCFFGFLKPRDELL